MSEYACPGLGGSIAPEQRACSGADGPGIQSQPCHCPPVRHGQTTKPLDPQFSYPYTGLMAGLLHRVMTRLTDVPAQSLAVGAQ